MRIVIDMQGAQGDSRNRGIGRYTRALVSAIVRVNFKHDIILVLNGMFTDSIIEICEEFKGIIPQKNIRVWYAPTPAHYHSCRRQAVELVYEAFIASLRPDLVLLSSIFEGYSDNSITSIKRFANNSITASICYDLIPYIHPDVYLDDPSISEWYMEKFKHFQLSDLCLAISESSRNEAIKHLGLSPENCVNISSDADAKFEILSISAETERSVRERYRVTRKFVMYTSGQDFRKNNESLICAYAKLSSEMRRNHQLVIVCSMDEYFHNKLITLAQSKGLSADELIITGFVSDEDLIILYNLCAVFVFPAWHEGFGLPILEAMRCGAPVIASNVTSMPEICGMQEAMFDPHSEDSMAKAIERVLEDNDFRDILIANGKTQAKKFSWDAVARRAIHAMENAFAKIELSPHLSRASRPKLAYVSPLPPERSGISEYSAQLLPALSHYYDIEVIVSQKLVNVPWIKQHCSIRTVKWFMKNSHMFDRVLYHFGNSLYHEHMFDMLQKIPGVVVLHDFFLSGMFYYSNRFIDSCFQSHGYKALLDLFASSPMDAMLKYPCNLEVIADSIGTIFHSESTLQLVNKFYGYEFHDFAIIPLLSYSENITGRSKARDSIGIPDDKFVVCSFGYISEIKLNHRLLNAWLESDLAKSGICYLIFVGSAMGSDYGDKLRDTIKNHPYGGSVLIIDEWVDDQRYRDYLSAADIGVQLRTCSRGETSASVLECMNYGIATIVNNHGSFVDLDDNCVWKLPDMFDDAQLIEALETLWRNHDIRKSLGTRAKSVVIEKHNPARCAALYKNAIEDFYTKNPAIFKELIANLGALPVVEKELDSFAASMALTFHKSARVKQLFVDVSAFMRNDLKTGIKNVVRHTLSEWLKSVPVGYRVEPVYGTVGEPYKYARQFTAKFLKIPETYFADEPIYYTPGDVFFVLDVSFDISAFYAEFYQQMRRDGVVVKFMVYDLLPIKQPQYFPKGMPQHFYNWLKIVGASDGAVCISKSVADELEEWIDGNTLNNSFTINWNHIGADIDCMQTVHNPDQNIESLIRRLQNRCNFLMVGTVEPRKGHAQVLDAFEQLWKENHKVNLVFVGKEGCLVDRLVQKIRNHAELNKQLFWLEGINNKYLEQVYSVSICMIAASYGEGFCLPLIEAAKHNIPIIARDILVFREVAGENAFYFDVKDSAELALAIQNWLKLYQSNKHPTKGTMSWLTWKESSAQLFDKVCDINLKK